jgi:hypothetical protein
MAFLFQKWWGSHQGAEHRVHGTGHGTWGMDIFGNLKMVTRVLQNLKT